VTDTPDDHQPDILLDLESEPLSTKQLRAHVAAALSSLQSLGIKDWEILEAWSDITWKAGNHKATRVLEDAAHALKKEVGD